MYSWLYQSYERLAQDILIPVVIACFASLVRVALYGWHGVRDYCASLCAGCFASVCAAWILSLYDFPITVNGVIIGIAGITGKDTLSFLLSRKTMARIAVICRRRLLSALARRCGGDNSK